MPNRYAIMLAPRCKITVITSITTIKSTGITTIKDANTSAPTTKSHLV